jgi:D-3-phosphoglycerate dehydrogenase
VVSLGAKSVSFEGALRDADFLTIHVPLNRETKNMINEEAISLMKRGAFIINCARGGIVDESALLRALNEGRIRGVALDVYENEPPEGNPLIEHPNCIATPHIAASTEEAQERIGVEVAQKMIEFFGR